MDKKRLNEIINQEKINEIYYNDRPIWVQETDGIKARIGFLDGTPEQNVYIKDLYENNNKAFQ